MAVANSSYIWVPDPAQYEMQLTGMFSTLHIRAKYILITDYFILSQGETDIALSACLPTPMPDITFFFFFFPSRNEK